MNKGDIIIIYKDPYTEQIEEGKAKLLEKIDDNELFEEWLVRFEGDEEHSIINRSILKK